MNAYRPISYVYADKIKHNKINSATGQVWKLADVPVKYRSEVEAILNGN